MAYVTRDLDELGEWELREAVRLLLAFVPFAEKEVFGPEVAIEYLPAADLIYLVDRYGTRAGMRGGQLHELMLCLHCQHEVFVPFASIEAREAGCCPVCERRVEALPPGWPSS